MEVFVVWGFLGSGKTTFICNLLALYLKGKKVVILENESGEQSVDGIVLESKQYAVRNMKSGCICCSLRQELPLAVKEIETNLSPDLLLIEAAGISALDLLLNIPGLRLNGVFSLVDVACYDLLMRLNRDFYRKQFALSPVLILTKGDQAGEEQVDRVKADIASYRSEKGLFVGYEYFTVAEWDYLFCKARLSFRLLQTPGQPPVYESQTFDVDLPLSKEFCASLLEKINQVEGDAILRAKGIFYDESGRAGKFDYLSGSTCMDYLADPSMKIKPFLSVWWNASASDVLRKWLRSFFEAEEVNCPVEELVLPDEELYAYLGFQKSGPDEYLSQFIERLKQEALAVCRPRIGFRLLPGAQTDKEHLFLGKHLFTPGPIICHSMKGSEYFVLLVASVGKEMDTWMEAKRAGGDVMEGFVADALGSAIVEAVVAWGLNHLHAEQEKMGLKNSNSYSPGYCGWNVAEQQLFFSMLPPAFCGVTLTSSSLMLPIKSVSAVVGLGKELKKRPYGCAICRKFDCFKRRL